jgi:nitrogen fixation protein NifQ
MGASEVFSELTARADPACDSFDIHVAASILAIGLSEARSRNTSLSDRVGLDGQALRRLAATLFPAAVLPDGGPLTVDVEEQSVRDIMWMFATDGSPFQRDLSCMIARRGLEPHHLWQDLGLRNRGELSQLMHRHFATLARRNVNDMKWKKFLYRLVCGTEGFAVCASPVCSDCNDYDHCFGDESGTPLWTKA